MSLDSKEDLLSRAEFVEWVSTPSSIVADAQRDYLQKVMREREENGGYTLSEIRDAQTWSRLGNQVIGHETF